MITGQAPSARTQLTCDSRIASAIGARRAIRLAQRRVLCRNLAGCFGILDLGIHVNAIDLVKQSIQIPSHRQRYDNTNRLCASSSIEPLRRQRAYEANLRAGHASPM